jgi:hypothetical protein
VGRKKHEWIGLFNLSILVESKQAREEVVVEVRGRKVGCGTEEEENSWMQSKRSNSFGYCYLNIILPCLHQAIL